ncbi:Taste receptor cell protein 1 [Microtus ochrogaster]|uniref:Taste receptor cell protein 1 n=1 Tax=Microtus ochrogaster TaxID=79684 RepID=A0A8J6G156_MICOH|nr:Taste receptor cell protein 1 [Microtus ochrogaster]
MFPDIDVMDDNNIENGLSPEASLNCEDRENGYCDQEEDTPEPTETLQQAEVGERRASLCLSPDAASLEVLAGACSMDKRWFPAAGTLLARMPNTLNVTEPLLPASSGASRLGLPSQVFTVGSGSAENAVALATGPDLSSSTPGPSQVIHSVTFRINSERFTTAAWNLMALKRQMLERFICYQLQLVYREAFSSFKNVSALLFRPGSTEVQASLVFGQPDPSALEILWTLYRKVKGSRWLLGHLSLTDNSLSSDGYNVTDLSRETVSISFILMRPFLPQLLLPGSQAFILLEKQILPLVTPEVSRFYKANPQDQPLLLFSNVNEWVSIYMEYKFKSPIPTHLQGLASYLAHHITDPTLQKSSMVANGEKAELALYETWLLILDHPFIKALENKTSSESQELRGLLTKWLTSVLQPLQNFGQVVVEEFQQEPLTAKVQAAFFGAAPAQAVIQDCMHQALSFLQEAEGLQFEMFIPVLDDSRTSQSMNNLEGGWDEAALARKDLLQKGDGRPAVSVSPDDSHQVVEPCTVCHYSNFKEI